MTPIALGEDDAGWLGPPRPCGHIPGVKMCEPCMNAHYSRKAKEE